MSRIENGHRREPGFYGQAESQRGVAPGREAMVLTAVAIGILLLGVQLWLLTIALDRYYAGAGKDVWTLAIVSGAIFVGGLLALWLLGPRRRVRRR